MEHDRQEEILIKIAGIEDELSQMNVHFADYNADLKIHIAATQQNRESILELKRANDIFQAQLTELKEIAIARKATLAALGKVFLTLSSILGLIFGGFKLFFK